MRIARRAARSVLKRTGCLNGGEGIYGIVYGVPRMVDRVKEGAGFGGEERVGF